MPHPLVTQLRFARSEFLRGLEGLKAEEAIRRFEPMNCISWMVGHLADQEHRYWVGLGLGWEIAPGLNDLVGYGKPASAPPLDEMLETWHKVISVADEFLDTLDAERLSTHRPWKDGEWSENVGTMLMRNIFHYWYHTGESQAVRQMLGHTDLPVYVGDMSKVEY